MHILFYLSQNKIGEETKRIMCDCVKQTLNSNEVKTKSNSDYGIAYSGKTLKISSIFIFYFLWYILVYTYYTRKSMNVT